MVLLSWCPGLRVSASLAGGGREGGDSWVAVITWLNGGEPLFKRSYTNQQTINEGSLDVPQLFEHQQQQACLSMDNDSFSLIQNLF